MENVLSVISFLGLGAIVGSFFTALWERNNNIAMQKQEFKETRYKCIILLMLGLVDFNKERPKLIANGRNFSSIHELKEELITEWNNMMLFASDEALIALNSFIRSPNINSYRDCVLTMRKDLYGGKLSKKVIVLNFD